MSATQTTAPIDEQLLHATIKLNTAMFSAVCGGLAGITLFLVTLWSAGRTDHYLDLLGIFLPGYSASVEGAWFGLLWGFLLGTVFGAIIYRVYARGIRGRVTHYLAGGTLDDLQRTVLRLDANALGLALGGMAAIGLIITTNWLVLRGTAGESVHAALLAHYLPGYTVTTLGSLIGGLEMFVVAYVFCALFATIYNRVADRRERRKARP